MAYIQLSLFGKTLQELLLQEAGWISEPFWSPSARPPFQFLYLESGRQPEWWEGMAPISAGGLWTPSIGEAPDGWRGAEGCFSWQILEENVPERYYLNPVNCTHFLQLAERAGCRHSRALRCTHFLQLAERAGCRPPEWIEYLLLRQGGKYQSFIPLKSGECGRWQKKGTKKRSSQVLKAR